MKPKRIINILLLSFVLGSVVFLIAGESLKKGDDPIAIPTNKETVTNTDPPSTLQREKAKETSPQSSHKIIAYYFVLLSCLGRSFFWQSYPLTYIFGVL